MKRNAIILAQGRYHTPNAKVAHGLVRGSDRFNILAVVDADTAWQDAGEVLDGVRRGIPVLGSLDDALDSARETPEYAIVGVATHGGRFTPALRTQILEAVRAGLSIVNGLHDNASDDPEIAEQAQARGVTLIDLRKPRPKHELHFWTGDIQRVRTPRIAVLGTDCALGKRTTARLLVEALNADGIKTEMIYTGQTGWMQGGRYGFVLDSIYNDYVSGELEHAVVTCEREVAPDLMVIEGQSSLRNPSGPCGAELLLSAGARAVVLQHAPGREHFEGFEEHGLRIPSVADELKLIALYGARTLAVTLNGEGLTSNALIRHQDELQDALKVPVIRPLEEGVNRLVAQARRFQEAEAA